MIRTENESGFGVNLIAYIRAEMGLGAAARDLAHALKAAAIPFNVLNFEQGNLSRHRDETWKHKESDFSSYDFTILAVNPDNIANAYTKLQKRFVRDRYTIGYWTWELPEIPAAWMSAFALVDEVWVPSRFVQDAVAAKSPVPVFRVPYAIEAKGTTNRSRSDFGLPDRQFLFLSMSDAHSELARKNPLGVLQAFENAFPENMHDTGLVLKINNAASQLADPEALAGLKQAIARRSNIYLLDKDMTGEEVDALLGLCDCFVSLHRSEGFGLGPAEAMSLGKPVIVTNWSGNVDYITANNSAPVNYRLVAVGKQRGPYAADQTWAEPDLDHASEWMKRIAGDAEFAARIGRAGRETILEEFAPKVIGRLINDRLTVLQETLFMSGNGDGSSGRHGRAIASNATPELVSLRIYSAGHSGYSEDLSIELPYQTQRWSHMHIALEHGIGKTQLRLDPMSGSGLIDIAGVAVKSAITGEVLWRASGRGGLETLETGGSALRIPHDRLARVFSYGDDPQILLPRLNGPEFDGPLRMEIWLKVETRTEPIRDAMVVVSQLTSSQPLLWGTKSLVHTREQTDAILTELTYPRSQLGMLQQELDEARVTIQTKTEMLADRDSVIARTELELAEARQEIIRRDSAIERIQVELAEMQRKISRTSGELQQAHAELQSERKQLTDKTNKARELTEKAALAEQQIERYEAQMDDAGKELEATTGELAKLSGQIGVLKRQIIEQEEIIARLRGRTVWQALFQRDLIPTEKDRSLRNNLIEDREGQTFWLEHPMGPSVVGKPILVSGWVVTPSGERIEGVEAVVDGMSASGMCGLERADVAAAHQGRSDFRNSGFIIELALPGGSHRVTLRYLTGHGWVTFCSFEHEVMDQTKPAHSREAAAQ